MTSPIRAVLRIARRDVGRAKGRSLLIVLMIAVPVMVMVFADVTARSSSPDALTAARTKTADADLLISVNGSDAIDQNPAGAWSARVVGGKADETVAAEALPSDLTSLFPAGSTVIPDASINAQFTTRAGLDQVQLRGLDVNSPAGSGLYRVLRGSLPATSNQVAINSVLAKAAGLDVGGTLDLPGLDTRLLVTAVIENPRDLKSASAVTTALPAAAEVDTIYASYRVKLGGPFSWASVKKLNDYGLLVTYPAVIADPPPTDQIAYEQPSGESSGALQTYGLLILVGGLAALEICLLAGTAFAVGARRQRRSLALLSASGGTNTHVRNVVLATGVVLGVVSAAVGMIVGIAIASLFRPLVETELAGQRFAALVLKPLDLAVIFFLGVATAVVSAVLPARSATRMNVPAALAGRPDPIRTKGRHRLPIGGLVFFLIGVVLLALSATRRELTGIMAGAVFAELGLVMLTSTLLGFIGRFGRRLPLAPRMALRDAVRNRPRTAPAVAAIMAGIAGAMSISMLVLGYSLNDKEDYQPIALNGQVVVPVNSSMQDKDVIDLQNRATQIVPARATTVRTLLTPSECEGVANCNYGATVRIPPCPTATCITDNLNTSLMVGSKQVLDTYSRSVTSEDLADLENGTALVTAEGLIRDGKVAVGVDDYSAEQTATRSSIEVPARLIEVEAEAYVPGAFVSKATADRLQFAATDLSSIVLTPAAAPTEQQVQALQLLIGTNGQNVYVERGWQDGYQVGLLVLAAASTLLALLATAIATGLALADGANDQATLSAVGANPRFRKTMSSFQAAVIALLGVGLGLLTGFLPGAAFAWFVRYQRQPDGTFVHRSVDWIAVIPWANLALLVVVVPLVAALFAWVFTRSTVSISKRPAL